MPLWPENWLEVLLPQAPIVESLVRATAIYLFAFLLFRVVLRRESGGLGISDLLVIILIAAAAHASLAGDAYSVGDAFVLIGTLVFWDWLLSYVAYHSGWFLGVLRPRPVPLVKDGRMLRHNMHKELLTRRELEEQLRLRGIGSVNEVKAAYMEPDGEISVIRRDGTDDDPTAKPERLPDLHR